MLLAWHSALSLCQAFAMASMTDAPVLLPFAIDAGPIAWPLALAGLQPRLERPLLPWPTLGCFPRRGAVGHRPEPCDRRQRLVRVRRRSRGQLRRAVPSRA